jgi:ribonuclease Z
MVTCMSPRELVVFGTASQSPTRLRNHNGYLLRWDDEGFLFDPGEGTQRQMTYAGSSTRDITRICLTHFHGDHCLGVPGVLLRMNAEQVQHTVTAHYPALTGAATTGAAYFERMRYATVFHEVISLQEQPVVADGVVAAGAFGELSAMRLDHLTEAYGYRLVEPDGRRMRPELLAQHGIAGPDIGRLQRDGSLGGVRLSDVSERRRGQRFAFIMDTRLCDAVYALAEGVDLLVIESTFLDADAELATAYGHLTAKQAARVAAESGVRTLVLTHFSQRYTDMSRFLEEAAASFDGTVVVAEDLMRVPVPPRSP